MTTSVKAGKGWINGYFIVNDGDYVLKHDNADGLLKRIDRVVMKLNHVKREIEVLIKKGTFASSPVAPTLQRDADAYELALADVLINNGATQITQSNITDQRLNSTLCGIVHGTVNQVDTTTIFNQYQSWFNDIKGSVAGELDIWKDAQEQEFLTWFESIKDILDGDVAGNLASRIASLEQGLANHIADVSHIKWIETVGGTANALTATDTEITSYKNGLAVSFPATSNSTAAMTLNINGLGVIPIKKANGAAFSNAKVNGVYTVRYRAGAFILQGEGGSGNAQPSDVRKDKTFTNDNGEQVGTLVAYGVNEQMPIDKLQCDLVNTTITIVLGDLTDVSTFYPEKSIHYDYNNLQYHAIGLGGHKKFSWAGGIMGSLPLSATSYVFAFDEEHGFIYLMYTGTTVAKVNVKTLAVIWETPQYSGLNAASAAHIPNNQGVAIAVSATNTFQCTGYNKDGQQKWRLNYNAYLGAHRAMCADRAGDIYLAAQNTETNVTSLYKISGTTGAVIVGPVSIYTGYYSAHRMMVDETSGRLVILLTDGNLRSYRTSDLAIVFTMPNAQLTSGGVSLDIDKKGNVYIGVRGGSVNLYGVITPGVAKFSPTLSYMWRMGNTVTNYPNDISIAVDKDPSKEYPDFVIALPKASTIRYKQTITVKS
ncbi:hypothetical protein [Lysinibacillus sp. GbtcB16]|uniref:hypothetical protein n=1 Tax=Lysinibacillus sp. GbtcB16 TaxID=2824761 RepID=UPI001C2F404E|nr:hypothetical protein [Lysinibacillus sp. GbtcB16]